MKESKAIRNSIYKKREEGKILSQSLSNALRIYGKKGDEFPRGAMMKNISRKL